MTAYVGRFAPSPSGPLHFGSLTAALASFLDARQHGGRWLLRIEDIDPPREVAGAADDIVAALHCHGFRWDGAVTYQSRRSHLYDAALAALDASGHLYACSCTRKQMRAHAGAQGCPGDCRNRDLPREDNPLRVAVPSGIFSATDLVLGQQSASVADDPGDFLLRRRGGLYAYQLAVVVDDFHQGINCVVRGADLLDNSPRQVALATLLGYPIPDYLHVPLALDDDGRKLSKQTGAAALDSARALDNLLAAWTFLRQCGLPGRPGSVSEFLETAVRLWSRRRLPSTNGVICC